jgi:hypothetical protein
MWAKALSPRWNGENDGNVAYEVEVRLDNGSEVEVGLGADFAVLNQAAPEFDDD